MGSNGKNTDHYGLDFENRTKFIEKHVQSAVVRTICGLFTFGLVIIFYIHGFIGYGACLGGAISASFLVLMSIPSLIITKSISKKALFNIVSALINLTEILTFSSVIYFLGGVKASFLLPGYAFIIIRVSAIVPKRYPYAIALTCALAFASIIIAQNKGLLPTLYVNYPLMPDKMYGFWMIVMACCFLLGIAAMTSYSSGILKSARNTMVEKNRELEKSREDLSRYSTNLEQSERKYKRVFQSIQTVYMEVDKKGIILEISPSIEVILGVKRKSILGQSIFLAPYVRQDAMYFLSKDVLENGFINDREIQIKNSSGKILTLSVSARIIKDEYRPQGCAVVDVRNVTDKHEAETALRESEERYRMLIEELKDVVFVLNPDGYIDYTSSATMEFGGYQPEDVVGNHFQDFLAHQNDKESAGNLFSGLLTSKKPQTVEILYRPKSKPPFFVEVSGTPIISDGDVSGVLCIMRDISSRKLAQEQIRSLNHELMNIQEKERKRIALDLHDDVAQDLASLLISCETFFDKHQDIPSDLIHKMKHVSQILKRSLNFIRDLSYELRPPGLDQLGLITTLSRYCDDFSDKNGIQVDFYSVGMGAFAFDPETEINIYRLVQEALNNVKKHALAKHVTIKFTASVPDIFIRIMDNGLGFNVDDRLMFAINEKRMGIHSMNERVNFMGGKFKIISQPDQGTSILVTIPGDRFRKDHDLEIGQHA